MESDTHLLYFTKLSGKSQDFYFLVGIHLNVSKMDPRREKSIFMGEIYWLTLCWRHKSIRILVKIGSGNCLLFAINHYLYQCWLIIGEAVWRSPEGNAQDIYCWYAFKITAASPKSQWVKSNFHEQVQSVRTTWQYQCFLFARQSTLIVVITFKCSGLLCWFKSVRWQFADPQVSKYVHTYSVIQDARSPLLTHQSHNAAARELVND